MADESNLVPPARVVRWLAIGALILFAVALYFRDGRRLAPLGAEPAAPSAPPPPADRAPD